MIDFQVSLMRSICFWLVGFVLAGVVGCKAHAALESHYLDHVRHREAFLDGAAKADALEIGAWIKQLLETGGVLGLRDYLFHLARLAPNAKEKGPSLPMMLGKGKTLQSGNDPPREWGYAAFCRLIDCSGLLKEKQLSWDVEYTYWDLARVFEKNMDRFIIRDPPIPFEMGPNPVLVIDDKDGKLRASGMAHWKDGRFVPEHAPSEAPKKQEPTDTNGRPVPVSPKAEEKDGRLVPQHASKEPPKEQEGTKTNGRPAPVSPKAAEKGPPEKG